MFGKMKLEDFKDLLSPADYKTCENKMINGPAWFLLTLDVFVIFLYKLIFFFFSSFPLLPWLCSFPFFFCLFQREISNTADNAARFYREHTPEALKSAPAIWDAMTKTQDSLIKTIRSRKFEKYISVATRTMVMTSSTRCFSYVFFFISFLARLYLWPPFNEAQFSLLLLRRCQRTILICYVRKFVICF